MQKPPKLAVDLNSRKFHSEKYAYYSRMLEQAPVYRARLGFFNVYLVVPHGLCKSMLKDERFNRDRSKATGKSRFPIHLPNSVKPYLVNMLNEDGEDHHRKRTLVHKAFTNQAIQRLETTIESLTQNLLDEMGSPAQVNLIETYSLPIPVAIIKEIMGVSDKDMPEFTRHMSVLTKEMSWPKMLKVLFWDIRSVIRFSTSMIDRKKNYPGDDILTALINAEESGDRLSSSELVSFSMLLIMAGYETTVHLITNCVYALIQHPQSLQRLREDSNLIPQAIEEVLRFNGPIHSTEAMYANQDVDLEGYRIPKGSMAFPLLGAANRDPSVFSEPDRFDIDRSPNQQLSFGYGPHFCLGAMLARLETRIAIKNLINRFDHLQLAVENDQLLPQRMPMWHRYAQLPVILS